MRPLLLALVLSALAPPVEAWAAAAEAQAVSWNDWRVWSVAAAFFGFTFGTLIKFGFDLWLDHIRRNREKVVFAIAFRAELGTLISDAKVRVIRIECRAMTSGADMVSVDIPEKAIYANNTQRLGDLGGRIAQLVVHAHACADHIRQIVAAALAYPSKSTLTPDYLDSIRRNFLILTRDVEKAHNALDVLLGDAERYPNLTDIPDAADPAVVPAEPADPAPEKPAK